MLTKLLKSMGSKPEKTDIKHLLTHAKELKKQSSVWRKGKKVAEAEGLADIDSYFRKDLSSLLDKHAKAYEKVAVLLKPAKPDRDIKAIKASSDGLKAVLSKLSTVLQLYKALLANGMTKKARALVKQHGKDGGKVMPKDDQLKEAIGNLCIVLSFDIEDVVGPALRNLAPYVRGI